MSRYYRISPGFWLKAAQQGWSEDAKLLALYLLTCEHRTTEGLFRLPKPYIQADLGWKHERFTEPFRQLLAVGFINYDDNARVILLRKALKYQRPENPNQQTAAIRILQELPPTPLWQEFLGLAEQYAQPFAKRLRKEFAHSPSPSPSPSPEEEQNNGAALGKEWLTLRSFLEQNRPQWLMTPLTAQKIMQDTEEFGADVLQFACEQAVLNAAQGYGYVNTVLADWRVAGVKSMERARAQVAEHQARRQGRNREPPKKPRDPNTPASGGFYYDIPPEDIAADMADAEEDA